MSTEEDRQSSEKPPAFSGQQDEYQEWISLLAMWLSMTRTPANAQASTIALRLSGRARTIATSLSLSALRNDELVHGLQIGLGDQKVPSGVHHLIQSLNDSGYLQSQHMTSFSALDAFLKVDGRNYPNIMLYTTDFETKYLKANSLSGLTIDQPSLAMMLLIKSGVSDSEHSRVISTAGPADKLTLTSMKSALHWLFGRRDAPATEAETKREVFAAATTEGSDDDYMDVLEESVNPAGEQVFLSRKLIFNRHRPQTRPTSSTHRIQCFRCQKFGHFHRDCPLSSSSKSTFLAYPTASSSVIQNGAYATTCHAEPTAICDSACTSTVMGTTCLRRLKAKFPSAFILEGPSDTVFQFGQVVKLAISRCLLPIVINNIAGFLRVEVVPDNPQEAELPLLLSKSALKALGVSICFGDDEGCILGLPWKFSTSSQGHYIIPFSLGLHHHHPSDTTALNAPDGSSRVHVSSVILADDDSVTRLRREVIRLHQRLGHPPATRLLEFLGKTSSGVSTTLRHVVNEVRPPVLAASSLVHPSTPDWNIH